MTSFFKLHYTSSQLFFTSGFQDVDRDEVEELIPSSCLLDVLVQLQVPSNPREYPKIAKIMMNLSKNDFKFDVTCTLTKKEVCPRSPDPPWYI